MGAPTQAVATRQQKYPHVVQLQLVPGESLPINDVWRIREVNAWCAELYGERGDYLDLAAPQQRWTSLFAIYHFRDEVDAVFFKLRWVG